MSMSILNLALLRKCYSFGVAKMRVVSVRHMSRIFLIGDIWKQGVCRSTTIDTSVFEELSRQHGLIVTGQ
jgi:hypothetical protein